MTGSSFSSLRVRAAAFVLLAVAPLFAIVVAVGVLDRRRETALAFQEVARQVEMEALQGERILEGARELLTALARVPEIREADPAACDAFLRQIDESFKRYVSLLVVHPDGSIVCSAAHPSEASSVGHDCIERARETRQFAVGSYEIDPRSGQTVLPFAQPVLDEEGRLVRIVVVSLDLEWLNTKGLQPLPAHGSTTLVFDRTGRVLFRQPEPARWLGHAVGEAPLARAARSSTGSGTIDDLDIDGIRRLQAFRRIGPARYGLSTAVGRARDAVLAPVRQSLYQNLAALTLAAVLAAGAAWLGSQRLVLRPVNDLLVAIRRLEEGDLTARVGLGHQRTEEIRQLATAYDRMADSLEMRDAELRESRSLLERVFDGTTSILFLIDERGRILLANQALARFYGAPVEEIVGVTQTELHERAGMSRRELATWLQDNREVLETGRPASFVEYSHDREGRGAWYQTRKIPITLGDGTGAVLVISGDVTEVRRLDDALRRTEARYRTVFETMQHGVTLHDPEGRIVDANPAAQEILGLSHSELTSRRTIDPRWRVLREDGTEFPAAERPSWVALRTGKLRTGVVMGVWNEKEGDYRWIVVSAVPLTEPGDDRPYLIHTTFSDITEQRRVSETVRQHQEVMQTILDNIPVMIVFISPAGRTEWVNREWERVLGWSLEEAQRIDVLAEMYPDLARRQEVLEFSLNPSPGWHDFRTQVRSGRVLDTSWANVRLSDGRSIGIGQDVTDRKRSEEALRSLSHRLLVAQEEERRRLARELHDEIGQVLTAVKIGLDRLRQDLGEKAAPRIDPSLASVSRAIDQVRGLSLELRPPSLDDLGLAAALEWYVRRQTREASLEAEVLTKPLEPRLSREVENACFRVAQEAVTNVLRHAGARRVTVKLHTRDEEVELEVADDGVGFDVEGVRVRAAFGECVGLSGMRERVALAGGRLEVRSTPGSGTEIRARFPLGPVRTDGSPEDPS